VTARTVGVVVAAALVGAAAGVAGVLVAEAGVRRGRRLVAELVDVFPEGWLS